MGKTNFLSASELINIIKKLMGNILLTCSKQKGHLLIIKYLNSNRQKSSFSTTHS